jgi:excisionase family DNA binding protein
MRYDGSGILRYNSMSSNFLTTEEVAAYLKISPETVRNQATQGKLPGRKISDDWRFLKDVIDDWLRSQDTRTIFLQQAGALTDDESLDELLAQIYLNRGRSEVEPE